MNHKGIKYLDELGKKYKILVSIVYKAKKPVKASDVNKIVTWRLFKRTHPISEEHFKKLEEYGFLEKTDEGYVTSELFEEWLRENTKVRKAKTREKLINPLGLIYFHNQDYGLENLLMASEKKDEILREYDSLVIKTLKRFFLDVGLPVIAAAAVGGAVPDPSYLNYLYLGELGWMLFGYNYVECKMGEDVAELVENYREEILP